ncbi:MAG: hypothetical protein KU29_10385 [Sulfurovum sp. FS06-10]|jgi:cytochrome c553|nr:MAG: hypothetical protein KU29_10385 [Sulfurovum sp. FS06-10]
MTNKITAITISAIATIAFTACGTNKHEEVKTYKMSAAEVFQASCIKCHGANGEGNPEKKTPKISDKTIGELEQDIYDVKNGGSNQSSGTTHTVMEHNMQKLIEKGYDYDTKVMATYMYETFHK